MAKSPESSKSASKPVQISALKRPDTDAPEVKQGTADFRSGKGGVYQIVKGEHRIRIPQVGEKSEE